LSALPESTAIPRSTFRLLSRLKLLSKQLSFRSLEALSPKKKTSKPGRPRLPEGSAKAGTLRVRVTHDELRTIELAAKASKQTVSEWIRSKLNAALRG
jgi:predicted HicB family RNase H-like nuclease